MDSSGTHSEHQDPLDDLLRRYLLDNDPETEDGENILEMASDRVLSSSPSVLPSEDRGLEMIDRLKERFPGPELPVPGPTSGSPVLKWGLLSFGALAVTTIFLLLSGVLTDPDLSHNRNLKNIASPNINTLAEASDNIPKPEAYIDAEGISSLQTGDLPPQIFQDSEDLEVPMKGNRRKPNGIRKVAPNLDRGNAVVDPYPIAKSSTPPHAIPANMEEQAAPDPYPLRGLYAQTSNPSEYFQMEADKDHFIKGRKGTVLHIPKDAFVGESGESVSGLVQVEFKEIYHKADYVKSNLPTVSNGKQLLSGGVLYLDASAAGRRLQLAKGKEIYVEFADQRKVDTKGMNLYHGKFNEKGELNWVPIGGEFDQMIPLPLDEMYFDEFLCDCKGEGEWNRTLWEITDPVYANTWIATREFRERVRVLRDIGYYDEGLSYYRDHVHESLWKVDKAVSRMVAESGSQVGRKKTEDEYFLQFASARKTSTEPFDDHGVDLGRWDARRQLLYRSVSRKETERLLRLHKLRSSFVKDIESRLVIGQNNGRRFVKHVRRGTFRKAGSSTIKGFLLSEMGWTNLDKEAAPSFARMKTRKLKVRITGNAPLDAEKAPHEPVNTFVVYKNYNSMMPGSRITGQYSTFKKVPKNIEGWVIAIGYRGGTPYLGMTELPKEGREVEVPMARVTMDEYLAQLNNLN